MNPKAFSAAALCLAAWLVPAAHTAAQTAAAPKPGGTLKIALRGDPGTLDCHAISSSHVAFVLFPAYSTLLKFDADKYPAIAGDLAQSWTVSPDGLQYTFKLQPGVKFHDGTAMTAQDVKATYERLRSPPPGVVSLRQAQFEDIKSIDVVDAQTIRFRLGTRNSSMLTVFANPWNCIYSAARLQKDATFPAKNILGTGPFKLAEQSPGNRIVFEKFADYFHKGLPYLDKLELIVLANPAVVPALSSGQVDADFFTFSDALRDQVAKARGNKTVFSSSDTNTVAIVTFNSKRAQFADPRVRRALSMAVDRRAADATLPRLVAVKGTSPIYRAGTEYALPAPQLAKVAGFEPDINKAREDAKKLLAEAGASNLKMTLLAPNTRDPYEAYNVFLADAWRRIGVDVEIRAVDSAAYQAAKTARDFDAVLEWNSTQSLHPLEVFDKFVPGHAANFGGYQDDELTRLYQQIKQESDAPKLKALATQFQMRVLDNAYMVPLLWATRTTAVPAGLNGWKTPPTFVLNLDHARLWWDTPAR